MIALIDLHLSKAAWCRMSYWRKKTFKEVDFEDFCSYVGKRENRTNLWTGCCLAAHYPYLLQDSALAWVLHRS